MFEQQSVHISLEAVQNRKPPEYCAHECIGYNAEHYRLISQTIVHTLENQLE